MKVYNASQLAMMTRFGMTIQDVSFFTMICDFLDDQEMLVAMKEEVRDYVISCHGIQYTMFYHRLRMMRKAGLIKDSHYNIILTDTGQACKDAITGDKGLKYVHIAAHFYYDYQIDPNMLKIIKRAVDIRKNGFFLEVKTAQRMIEERPITRKYVKIA